MRILKLDLKAFGPFTDSLLDLSSGKEGLHVVYGPNEAGKSSTLRSITDFLYGIPSRTPDDFKHPYGRLRIGASLKHSDGTVLDLVRRKANQNSLRMADDVTPFDDYGLNRFLGDVDRELFQVMFGIDHAGLRRGGEEIVRGGGRIGELLFAAGAGIGDLRNVQIGLQTEIDELFKPSGRSGKIVVSIKDFQDNRTFVKDAQVAVDTWKRLDEELCSAKAQQLAIDGAIRDRRSDQNRLSRIRAAVPIIARWKKATCDFSEVRDAPLLAEDFADKSNDRLIEMSKSEQQKRDSETTIAKIDEQLALLIVPETMLRESDAIESLRDRLGGYRKAMLDRPKLKTARELAEGETIEILRKLGRPPDISTIEELRLPKAKTIRIQNLGNQQEGLIERVQSDRRECERIRRKIVLSEKKFQGIQISAEAVNLRASLRDIQKEGDLESQLDEVRREMQTLAQNVEVSLTQLSLWSGSPEDAEKLAVPSLTTVERFNDEFKVVQSRCLILFEKVHEEEDKRINLESRLMQLELEQKVPTVDELDTARILREQGWQLVLRAWQEGREDSEEVAMFLQKFHPLQSLQEAYHRSVTNADQISDSLRANADRVATKAKLQADIDLLKTREASLIAQLKTGQAELHDLETQWITAWSPMGISPVSPLEMRDWLRRQQDLVQVVKSLRTKTLEAEYLRDRIDVLARKIECIVKQWEPPVERETKSLRELLAIASIKCDEYQKTQSLREQIGADLESVRIELADAESRFAESELARSKWQSDWKAEMHSLGLEEDAVPSQANSVLSDLSSLFQKHQESDQFRARIEAIDRDAQEFEKEVREVVRHFAPQLSSKPVDEAVSLMAVQLQTARSTAEKHSALVQQRQDQFEKQQVAVARLSEIKAVLDELCRQAACTDCDKLSEAARRSRRRRELDATVQDLEVQILDQSGGAEFKWFLTEVEREAVDIDSLAPRLSDLDRDIERLGHERDLLVRLIERVESDLQKIDGSALAAERAADCESIASRLEDQVQELAVLRIASSILKVGIEQHRKKNQGPVLGRASEIFQKITLGAFDGLRADFNDRGEPVLTGVRSLSGDTIPVSGMSDGTCDQLYLALRLASLESWLEHHEAIPFIVDDVLLTFDDERAVASLKVLAELSHRTQIIFFTHHRHLVEIAKSNLSRHELFVATLSEEETPLLQSR